MYARPRRLNASASFWNRSMIWRFSVTASSQFPSKAAFRASSPSWRRVSCFCAKVPFLPTSDGEIHSSGRRNWLTHQEPGARARHLDVHELPVQIAIVVEVDQGIPPCAPGPPPFGPSFDEHFV